MDFQDVNPSAVVLFSVLYAEYLAETLPFNVQNVLGNVLELMGQVLLAYNSQQQYFEGGPGRCFSAKYRNVNNPFCNDENSSSFCNADILPDSEYIMELAKSISRDLSKTFAQ